MTRGTVAKGVVAVAAVLAVAYVLLGLNPRPPEPGKWVIQGADLVPWEAVLVLEHRGADEYSGHFVWRSTGGIEGGGRELVVGSFDESTRRLHLRGVKKTDEIGIGIGLGEYEATVAQGGRDLVKGSWRAADEAERKMLAQAGEPAVVGKWSGTWVGR